MFNINQFINDFLFEISSNIFNEKLIYKDKILTIKKNDNNFMIYNLNEFSDIYVIGIGKGSAFIAEKLQNLINDIELKGIIATKYGFAETKKISNIDIFECGHPYPDKNSLETTEKIINLLSTLNENNLVIFIITGGGSANFEKLNNNFTLENAIELNKFLLSNNYPITIINKIRVLISDVKGGKILKKIYPAKILALYESDVINDDLGLIAGGILQRNYNYFYFDDNLWNKFPFLKDGVLPNIDKNIIEYYSKDENLFEYLLMGINYSQIIVSQIANKQNIKVVFYPENLSEDIETMIKKFINFSITYLEKNKEIDKVLFLLNGEAILKLNKKIGVGGRNQHAVLLTLKYFYENKINNFSFFAFASDGNDGNSPYAGGYFYNNFLDNINYKELNEFIENFDSTNYLLKYNLILDIGKTNINIADLWGLLYEKKEN